MDVVKTRLQTQGILDRPSSSSSSSSPGGSQQEVFKPRYDGIASTARAISAEEGTRGFFRGMGPRVALAMPSAAMCWGTYETVRMVLGHFPAGSEAPPAPAAGRATPNAGATAESLDWEEWDGSTPFWQHAVAGSCAGMMEHVAMYPIDTIKTRMQAVRVDASQRPPGVVQTARTVLQEHGASGLMRGCFAIGAGCIPAHVGLFCTYEVAKARLIDSENAEHQPARAAACGAMATVVHDMIITPFDVVKQRLQLGCYRGVMDCLASVWRNEGLRGFYRSLPTTLISECPFHGILVACNESLKLLLGLEAREGSGTDRRTIGLHFVSTGLSGMAAAVATQPLDVVKTRLQTQSLGGASASDGEAVRVRYSGMLSTALTIYREEGPRGLFRGTVPRLAFAAPSAAMCWGTYEVTKAVLRGSS